MTKKGPLGKAEEFYIKHNFQSIDVDTLCKDLDRAKSLVERYIEKCKKEIVDSTPFNVQNQFIHKRGATIMTQEAAVLADTIRKSGSPNARSECVTKIK
jgi:capsid protein